MSIRLCIATITGLSLAAAGVGFVAPFGGAAPHEYGDRLDYEDDGVDPEFIRLLASRPRDPTGIAGSAVATQTHGARSKRGSSDKWGYESRLFRTGFQSGEPTLGITRNGWIFFIAFQGAGTIVIRSRDGGASWETVSAERRTQDPYLWVDPQTDRIFWSDWLGCGQLSYSDDHGGTWTEARPVGCGHNTDHQTIFAGPPVSSTTTGYPNVVYYCSIGAGATFSAPGGTTCSKSLDGGLTFAPTLTPPFPAAVAEDAMASRPGKCNGGSGHIFVGSDGALYVPRGLCGQPWLAISRDEGDTWSRVQIASNGMGKNANGIWDHEAAVRADSGGNVFYSWVARDRIPYLAVSRDHGATWSSPVRVAPSEVNEAFIPNMDLDESGRLALVYMASTTSPGAPFPNDGGGTPVIVNLNDARVSAAYESTTWTGYITVTRDPLAQVPEFQSAPVTTPEYPLVRGQCGPFTCQAVRDFIDIEFGPTGEIYAALVDTCMGGSACAEDGQGVVATLVARDSKPPALVAQDFEPDRTLAYALAPSPEALSAGQSPEGCSVDDPKAIGLLVTDGTSDSCHTAPALTPIEFTSAPLEAPLVVGGPARIRIHVTDPIGALPGVERTYFFYLGHVAPDGKMTTIGAGNASRLFSEGRNELELTLHPTEVAAGNYLYLNFDVSAEVQGAARFLYGGAQYGDSGLTLTVGHWDSDQKPDDVPAKSNSPPTSQGVLVGAFPATLLAPLALLGLIRRRRGLPR